jgi:mono/diheme cytochrome c family protein
MGNRLSVRGLVVAAIVWSVQGTAAYGRQQVGVDVQAGTLANAVATPTRTVWSGVFTDGQAARGERTYKANCGICHGIEARLSVKPVFVGPPFMARWRGQSLGDIFMTIKVNMPRENPESLSDEEYVDIVTYFLRENEMPVGNAELPATLEDILSVTVTDKPVP